MAENSNRSPITIGSDHDFRMGTVLRFYGPRAMGRQKAEYLDQGSWPQYGPEWLIRHDDSCHTAVPSITEVADARGNKYEFVKAFPSAPLAGMHWLIYHNRSH